MGQTRRVGDRNTTIVRDGDETVITYHQTDVVKFSPTTITLNSGGWRTYTTKARMNQTANQFKLNFSVFQDRGQWYVSYKGKTQEFTDGMTLTR